MAMSEARALTLTQVAARADVSPGTVRRWVNEGLIPQYNGGWSAPAAKQVGIVARLRERGYTLAQIREASDSGRLALGDLEDFLSGSDGRHTFRQAAREAGLAPELIE